MHRADLGHHILQAAGWLAASAEGENTVALSYAALELRYSIERLAVHYWITLLGRTPEAKDFQDIRFFKRIENRIYELSGHQLKINKHYEFVRILWNALQIDIPLITPNMGQLSKDWHTCSELCHISWPLSSSAAGVAKSAFDALTEISKTLAVQAQSMGWPSVSEGEFGELRARFIAGDAAPDEVRSYLEKNGVWARFEPKDGRPFEFVGRAIPPAAQK